MRREVSFDSSTHKLLSLDQNFEPVVVAIALRHALAFADGVTSYTCHCPFGTMGANCQLFTLGFAPLSYLVLQTLHHNRNVLSLEFATGKLAAIAEPLVELHIAI